MSSNIILAFDVYGTLLSTQSIADKLAVHFGNEKAATIARTWRRYQIEYTQRANSMGVYLDFDRFTSRSLSHALAESGVSLTEDESAKMMEAYNSLSVFPDVQPLLQNLSTSRSAIEKLILFSNGTTDMITSSLRNTPDLAAVFTEIVSVEAVRKFKPAPEVYWHLARSCERNVDDKAAVGQIWLISGNPFDVVGARAVGMNGVWVDREGTGWVDNMMPGTWSGPSVIVRGLGEVVGAVREAVEKGGIV